MILKFCLNHFEENKPNSVESTVNKFGLDMLGSFPPGDYYVATKVMNLGDVRLKMRDAMEAHVVKF